MNANFLHKGNNHSTAHLQFDLIIFSNSKKFELGSGCGAVGRAVACDTRGPEFESSHRRLLLNIYFLLTVCRKDDNKEKRLGMAHLKKKKKFDFIFIFKAKLVKLEVSCPV